MAFVSEGGVPYDQSVTSGTTQTVRKAGFEQIVDQSTHVASGTKSSADPALEQVIVVTDEDVNANAVSALSLNVRNAGTAAGSELGKHQGDERDDDPRDGSTRRLASRTSRRGWRSCSRPFRRTWPTTAA